MTDAAGEEAYVLTGSAAEEWYGRTRGGGHLLDAHLVAIREHFGPGVIYRMRAPIDPITGRPDFLIIEIDPPADLDPWQTLRAVESDLLDRRDYLSALSRRTDPFARVVITLRFGTEEWEAVRAEIEGME